MKVIDFEPYFWFFLKNKNDYFIDVNCNYSAFGFNCLIKLNEREIANYKEKGRLFLNSFANDIQNFATTKYIERRENRLIEELVNTKIIEFNKIKNHI